LHQVASFKTECRIPCDNLLKALNDSLPPTVRVKRAGEVPAEFHARYDARSKTYRYRIYQGPICSPFIWRFVWHYPLALDRVRVAKAARLLEGKHDFTSFAASDGSVARENPEAIPSEGPGQQHREGAPLGASGDLVRTVFSSRILWRPRASMLIYEIRGNGFLHHMVRNLVGTLAEVGKGNLAPQDIGRILEARDRTLAGPTAPARGLCLVHVEY
jgi:tRNA pseudouridine38-40 synthase